MKAILFDVGGPLLAEDDGYAQMLDTERQALREHGLHVSDEEFDETVERVILSFVPGLRMPLAWEFTKPDVEKCRSVYNRSRDLMHADFSQLDRVARPGMAELLETLARSYVLALAGNAQGHMRNVLELNGLLRFFTHTELSGDLGIAKPDTRFLEHIVRRCGVQPEEAVMVGDRLDNDIIPAKLLGMKTVWFRAGIYSVLEPRTPDEIPDATVTTVEELGRALADLGREPV